MNSFGRSLIPWTHFLEASKQTRLRWRSCEPSEKESIGRAVVLPTTESSSSLEISNQIRPLLRLRDMEVHLGFRHHQIGIAEPSFQRGLVPCHSGVLQPRRVVESRHAPGLPAKDSGQPWYLAISIHRMTTRTPLLKYHFAARCIAG